MFKPVEAKQSAKSRRYGCMGVGQLSLVEHALCPLDARTSLQPWMVHHATFQYSDKHRQRRTATAEISCPKGLSAHDEFYLWGLLALAVSQPNSEPEFHATPHYCLRELGLINAQSRRGGRQYQQFREAVERLSWVRYACDAFYDPIRAEHRRVSFGFLSYSLPLDDDSHRACRFHWDGLFFEFVRSAGGSLRFDLATYRQLSPAGRRLFLFASKVFARSETTPRMTLQHLAIDTLGLSPTLQRKHQLAKFRNVCAELAKHGIVGPMSHETIQRRNTGDYRVQLERGPYFSRRNVVPTSSVESPLADLLRSIGLDDRAVHSTLHKYPQRTVQEWADITLAAKERFGAKFFKRSPAAYFIDGMQNAVHEGRTPPDWWHDVRKAEERRQAYADRARHERSPLQKTSSDCRQAIEQIRRDVFDELSARGTSTADAETAADGQVRLRASQDAIPHQVRPATVAEILPRLPLKLS